MREPAEKWGSGCSGPLLGVQAVPKDAARAQSRGLGVGWIRVKRGGKAGGRTYSPASSVCRCLRTLACNLHCSIAEPFPATREGGKGQKSVPWAPKFRRGAMKTKRWTDRGGERETQEASGEGREDC